MSRILLVVIVSAVCSIRSTYKEGNVNVCAWVSLFDCADSIFSCYIVKENSLH